MNNQLIMQAVSWQMKGNPKEAIKLYEQFIKNNKLDDELCMLIGVAYIQNNQIEFAKNILLKGNKINPDNVAINYNLGILYKNDNDYKNAKKYLKNTLKIEKNNLNALNALSNIFAMEGDDEQALENLIKSYEINPEDSRVCNDIGKLFINKNDFHGAKKYLESAYRKNPELTDLVLNLAILYSNINKADQAEELFKNILDKNEVSELANYNIGNLYYYHHQNYDLAIKHYLNAYNINKNIPGLIGNLLWAIIDTCNWEKYYELKNELLTEVKKIHSYPIRPSILQAITSDSNLIKTYTEKWVCRVTKTHETSPVIINAFNERIKIGYFSNEFRDHAVMRLFSEALIRHDREKFEIYCYSLDCREDQMTIKIKDNTDAFISLYDKTQLEITEILKNENIDIAVDLTGYTSSSDSIFSRPRFAKHQVNFLGYPGTLGLKTVDYIIADHFLIPSENVQDYTEKIIYIQDCYQPNARRADIVTKSKEYYKLPEDSFVYCSFNNHYKITPEIFDAWMKILQNVDKSVLWLMIGNSDAKNNLMHQVIGNNIPAERVIFADVLPYERHLERYAHVDVFLDTFPYTAHTTCSDALYYGVPVVSRRGLSFQSRVSYSLLSNLNIKQLSVESIDDYITLAIELGTNSEKFSEIKSKLSNSLQKTNLFDPVSYIKKLELEYLKLAK